MAFYQMESLTFYDLGTFVMKNFGVRAGKTERNLSTQALTETVVEHCGNKQESPGLGLV